MARALSLFTLTLATLTLVLSTTLSGAWGATATLTQVAPPASYHPAHAIDVAGIVPGMSPDTVAGLLAKSFGPVQTTQENMGLQDQGVDVATQTYTTRMTATKGTDDVTVWFGTPTTGNGVVEATLQTIYANPADAPALEDVRAGLIAKYGPPAFDGPVMGTGEVRLLAWSYKGDKPAACTASSCRTDLTDGLSVADMGNYQRATRKGHDLTLVGMMLTGINDPTRVASVVMTVSDTATKLRTLDEAIRQMRAALRPAAASRPSARPRH